MITIKLPTSSKYTDPRTNGPLFRPGVRGCVLQAGGKLYDDLLALPHRNRAAMLDVHEVRVLQARLTYIDKLTEADLLKQVVPSWRTPEGAEAGLVAEHGDAFGRIVTVVHFEVV